MPVPSRAAVPSGNDVRVTILEIKGNNVQLGIDRTATTLVDREEVRERREFAVPALRDLWTRETIFLGRT